MGEHVERSAPAPLARLGFILTLCVVALLVPGRAAAAPCDRVLDQVLPQFRSKSRIPALAVSVVLPQGGCVRVLGRSDPGTGVAASARTRFGLASISKLVTTVAVMQLVEAGTLALDDPLEHHLPAFAGRGIRIEHLLTHSAGLRDVRRPAGRRTAEEVQAYLAAIARARPAYEAGEGWRYTDAAFNVLGAVVEHVSRAPFSEVVDRRVLAPLGMTHSTFDPRTLPPGAVALPFRRGWFGVRPSRSEWDLAFAPSSGLHATIGDLQRFARFALDRGMANGQRLLSEASFQAMWRPRRVTEWPGIDMGLGWQIVRREGDVIVQHAGSDRGYQSLLTLYPYRGVAITSAGNIDKWPRSELHRTLARRLLPLADGSAGPPEG